MATRTFSSKKCLRRNRTPSYDPRFFTSSSVLIAFAFFETLSLRPRSSVTRVKPSFEATSFDLDRIQKFFHGVVRRFPSVKASVENIPTHWRVTHLFALLRLFDYVTLDLRWAALYDELDAFESIIGKVVNVHLRGKLGQGK